MLFAQWTVWMKTGRGEPPFNTPITAGLASLGAICTPPGLGGQNDPCDEIHPALWLLDSATTPTPVNCIDIGVSLPRATEEGVFAAQ